MKRNSYSIIDGVVYVDIIKRDGSSYITIIDVDDWDILKDKSWYFCRGYVATYVKTAFGMTQKYMQQFITNTSYVSSKVVVHHLNGNNLDNRKCNLTIVSKRISLAITRKKNGRPKIVTSDEICQK